MSTSVFITVKIFLGGYFHPSLLERDYAEWRGYKSRKAIGGMSSGAIITRLIYGINVFTVTVTIFMHGRCLAYGEKQVKSTG